MNFVLPVPRYWDYPCFTSGDWLYLAGKATTNDLNLKTFEKFNVITGEVVKLEELRKPCEFNRLFEM